jgi:hypothetical protein
MEFQIWQRKIRLQKNRRLCIFLILTVVRMQHVRERRANGRFAANTQHRNYFELNLNRPATAATATGGSKKLAASFS